MAGYYKAVRLLDAMTTHLDIYPTIYALIGMDPPVRPRGVSLLPPVDGRFAELHGEIVGEVTWTDADEPVSTERFRRNAE